MQTERKYSQVQLQALIDSGKYDTREDFTVIIQPFLRDSVLPYTEVNCPPPHFLETTWPPPIFPQFGEVDATYFAPDCFHFSDIGHAMGAINLWNNMVTSLLEFVNEGRHESVSSFSSLNQSERSQQFGVSRIWKCQRRWAAQYLLNVCLRRNIDIVHLLPIFIGLNAEVIMTSACATQRSCNSAACELKSGVGWSGLGLKVE